MSIMKRLWNDEEAATAVEYGLVTAVIAVAHIGALYFFRRSIQNMFNNSSGAVNGAPTN